MMLFRLSLSLSLVCHSWPPEVSCVLVWAHSLSCVYAMCSPVYCFDPALLVIWLLVQLLYLRLPRYPPCLLLIYSPCVFCPVWCIVVHCFPVAVSWVKLFLFAYLLCSALFCFVYFPHHGSFVISLCLTVSLTLFSSVFVFVLVFVNTYPYLSSPGCSTFGFCLQTVTSQAQNHKPKTKIWLVNMMLFQYQKECHLHVMSCKFW